MNDSEKNQIRQLSPRQRRVLGALIEKAMTTPDAYPLTLNSTVSACNQKSNRNPVVSFSDEDVQTALDELRELGLVAEIFTGGGRTPRYRHYVRDCFDFNGQQIAVMAELLLRGRQQLGELRTRASRMKPIETLNQLREELKGLLEMGFLQTSGPLERRGIEVDHTFYLPKEGRHMETAAPATAPSTDSDSAPPAAATAEVRPAVADRDTNGPADNPGQRAATQQLQQLETTLSALRDIVTEQKTVIQNLQSTIADLEERLQRLERDLGV